MEGKTVLVIEDNELNRKLTRALLQMEDYGILEAEDAESGIELARRHLPDLILMDIRLPSMDGLTATKTIKADPALRDIPVVAFTSYAMKEEEEQAAEAGCDGYITKPINTKRFLGILAGFLR